MLRTAVQIGALALTLESAWFLARGSMGLTPAQIAELSRPKFGYNLEVAQSIAQQHADARVGTVLLLIAFALQLGHALWPMRIDDFIVDRTGAIVAVIVALIAFEGATRIANTIGTRQLQAVEQLLRNDAE